MNNRYFISGYLGDAGPFLSQQPRSGLSLATIRRNGGESDAWFRRSGNWVHRGAGIQPGLGGLTSNGWKRTGNINSEAPDAMSLLLSGGVEVLEVRVSPEPGWVVTAQPAKQLVRSPASVLYYTGHAGGNRIATDNAGTLLIHTAKGYETWFDNSELTKYWSPYSNLEVLILAGCGVLSAEFAGWGEGLGTGVVLSKLLRGRGGPLKAILGYGTGAFGDDWHSPLDSQGGNRVAAEMAKRITSGSRNYVSDWFGVNLACAKTTGGLHALGLDENGFHRMDQKTGAILPPNSLSG
jgi:hypothetical protein